jgi:hypothetical protein
MAKFKVGNRVKIINSIYSLSSYKGIISKIHPNSILYPYEVQVDGMKNPSFGNTGWFFGEQELELDAQHDQVRSSKTIEDPLKDYKQNLEKMSKQYTKSHICKWKTYTGLMYKEEYCDCGATKNRRGIYD